MQSCIQDLECSNCKKKHSHEEINSVCEGCGETLFARYDLEELKDHLARKTPLKRQPSLWRYYEILPVRKQENVISLGEGMTPITSLRRSVSDLGLERVLVKDDGIIPTGTFKARGQTVAISKAKELGIRKVAIPSAGNAAGAMATYASRADMEAFVFLPQDAPESTKIECEQMGARVYLVNGLINDAGMMVTRGKKEFEWYDVSTLKEPYRVEGKKTMGYEIAEQLNWTLPDFIIYPTGEGTNIIGMWKAFRELEQLGWISKPMPKFISVQSETCAPIVEAFKKGWPVVTPFPNPATIASGLRVPYPFSSRAILSAIRESNGKAVAVADGAMLDAMRRIAKDGISAYPEGATTLVALRDLVNDGTIDTSDTVVLYNTGTALKYLDIVEKKTFPVLAQHAENIPDLTGYLKK
jgi:threonine synthase